MMLSICFYGCKHTEKHNHTTTEAHAHEGKHAHNHQGHEHAHEGHPHNAGHHHEEEGHHHEGEENHNDEIIFTKAQAARTDFKVEEIQPGTFHQVIKTTGQVLPAPGDESAIVATTNGTISFANTQLAAGSPVKQNQPLFYIATKNLGEGDYYARVRAGYEKAKASYERAKELVKDNIISQKEYEDTRLEYQNAKIAYDAVSGKHSSQGIGIASPLNGFVKDITVKDGEYVTAGQVIATVSQNKHLVLRADVSEKHYAALPTVQSANFKTPYDNRVYSLAELSGRLLSEGKSAEANTFEFDNRGNVLPGSFVEIYLISSPLDNVLSIPESALTNEMGHFYVYKQLDEEGYQKQEVKIGASNGKAVQILSGLTAGDHVVIRGAYQVKMASASAAIPGHTHEH